MTPIAAAIITALVEIARRIGRWAVKKLSRWAVEKLLHYLEARVELFEERRKRAKRAARKKWLGFRIRNWTWAIKKIRELRPDLETAAVRAYCKATGTALAKVPMYAPHETCPAGAEEAA